MMTTFVLYSVIFMCVLSGLFAFVKMFTSTKTSDSIAYFIGVMVQLAILYLLANAYF